MRHNFSSCGACDAQIGAFTQSVVAISASEAVPPLPCGPGLLPPAVVIEEVDDDEEDEGEAVPLVRPAATPSPAAQGAPVPAPPLQLPAFFWVGVSKWLSGLFQVVVFCVCGPMFSAVFATRRVPVGFLLIL